MSASAITFALALRPAVLLAKVIVIRDGAIVDVRPSPVASLFAFREVEFGGLEDLMAALADAASLSEIAVRGRPKAPTGRRAIYDDPEKGPAGLEITPRRWVGFDWDGLPLEPYHPAQVPPELADDPAEFCNWSLPDPLLDPEIGVRACLLRLPPAFRDVTCGWQVTSSAGFKPGWRLRTWHWLDHPATGADLKTWLKPAIDRNLVDPVTLVEAQPHYLAVTVSGGPDLCPRRFGVLRLVHDAVRVPDFHGIALRQQAAARRAAPPPRPSSGPATPNAFLERCVDTVRRAADGTKHRVYMEEAARAKAFCDKHNVAWVPWRRDLMQTYEASLPPGEADKRRAGSIVGVMNWVEAR